MRLVVVGPTHPYKGGIAQHTTGLAHHLADAGHDVELWSWSEQYPARLYPGQQRVDVPEVAPYPNTSYPLSWKRPDGWVRAGRWLRRGHDAVVVAWVTPIQGPAYAGLLAAAGRRIRRVAVCHNVLPHERRVIDGPLTRMVLGRCDGLVVHAAGEVARAKTVSRARVEQVALPPILDTATTARPTGRARRRLLFFGLVRPYKGLDVLLRALAQGPPDVALTVAGEFWGGVTETEDLVAELSLEGRVELRPGYVDAADVPALFAGADALALPYRASSSSTNVTLAHRHGLPVIASDVGSMAAEIRDGVDGLLVPPDDPAALGAAVSRLYERGVLARLRTGVPTVDVAAAWAAYVSAVERLLHPTVKGN